MDGRNDDDGTVNTAPFCCFWKKDKIVRGPLSKDLPLLPATVVTAVVGGVDIDRSFGDPENLFKVVISINLAIDGIEGETTEDAPTSMPPFSLHSTLHGINDNDDNDVTQLSRHDCLAFDGAIVDSVGGVLVDITKIFGCATVSVGAGVVGGVIPGTGVDGALVICS
jgi:hypothetical protein